MGTSERRTDLPDGLAHGPVNCIRAIAPGSRRPSHRTTPPPTMVVGTTSSRVLRRVSRQPRCVVQPNAGASPARAVRELVCSWSKGPSAGAVPKRHRRYVDV